MALQLKLSKTFEKLSRWFRQKSLYLELDWHVKRQVLLYIKPVTDRDRGIGKTHTLVKLAHKYHCPIAVKSYESGELIRRSSMLLFKNPVNVVLCSNAQALEGKRLDVVLCEEGINDEAYRELLIVAKSVIGFRRWY